MNKKGSSAPVIRRNIKRTRREISKSCRLAYARLAVWMRPSNPDFLVIGPSRSATSWLFKRLSAHPDIYIPSIKEVHFFDRRAGGRESYVFDLDRKDHWRWYWSYYGSAGNKAKGDMTPDYSILPEERISKLATVIPDARIIYSIRNPVERAWSGLRHRLWYGKGLKPNQLEEEVLLKKIMHPEILEKGDHKKNIRKWEKYYGPDYFKCIFFEDVILKPRNLLVDICRFLQVEPVKLPDDGKDARQVNAVPSETIPDRIREKLTEYYLDQIPYLEDKFGRNLDSWHIS